MAIKEDQLIPGKLYQAQNPYYKNAWTIAEFSRTVQAYDQKYHNVNLVHLSIGNEKIRHIPKQYHFKYVDGRSGAFPVEKLSSIRETTDEAVAEVARYRAEIKQREDELATLRREFRNFCA